MMMMTMMMLIIAQLHGLYTFGSIRIMMMKTLFHGRAHTASDSLQGLNNPSDKDSEADY